MEKEKKMRRYRDGQTRAEVEGSDVISERAMPECILSMRIMADALLIKLLNRFFSQERSDLRFLMRNANQLILLPYPASRHSKIRLASFCRFLQVKTRTQNYFFEKLVILQKFLIIRSRLKRNLHFEGRRACL